VPEAIGTPAELGAELTCFLNDVSRPEVEAACLDLGRFRLRLEVEPHEGPGTLAGRAAEEPAQERVPLWEASATIGNRRGVFAACYGYGNSQGDAGQFAAPVLGGAQQVARWPASSRS